MGMYTEFVAAFNLKKDTPEQVISTLQFMLSPKLEGPKELPSHELFQCDRWRVMLRCDSYYFSGDTHSTIRYDEDYGDWYLTIRCNLKNSSDEIDKFIDWIKPYADDKGFIGYKRYEEDEHPTLIYI